MEFLVGLSSFLAAGIAVIVAIRRGSLWSRVLLWVGTACQVCVLASLGFDWGYSWVEKTAFYLVVQENAWLAVPHVLALLCLVGLARWGSGFAPWAVMLSALQASLFIPVLLAVEQTTSMSFLAPAPMTSLFAATLASLLFLPMACRALPDPSSRWYRIAFGPRQQLISAVAGLRELAFVVNAPASVLESGTAAGRLGHVDVEVSTAPALFPPAYRLNVRLWPAVPVARDQQPGCPGFAPREIVRFCDGGLEYEGCSPAAFAVLPEGLRAFVCRMAGAEGPGSDT